MTVGQRIKMMREEKGLSQLELAKKVGYETKGSISMIESGKRDISLDKVKEIANALDVTPHWLMGWSASPHDTKSDLQLTIDELQGLDAKQLARLRAYIQFLKFEGGKNEDSDR